MQVKSKYKNPDKLIEMMKKEIVRLKEERDKLRDDLNCKNGEFWFNYDKTGRTGFNPGNLEFARTCRIGDKVIIHGEIISIARDNIQFLLKEVRIKRKV